MQLNGFFRGGAAPIVRFGRSADDALADIIVAADPEALKCEKRW